MIYLVLFFTNNQFEGHFFSAVKTQYVICQLGVSATKFERKIKFYFPLF